MAPDVAPGQQLPEHIKFRMPDLDFEHISGGAGGATLSEWKIAEGDAIVDGTHICEIDTPDLTFTLDSGDEGFLARILVPAGTKDVAPGQPLAIIVPTREAIAPFCAALRQHPRAIEGHVEPVQDAHTDDAAQSNSASAVSAAAAAAVDGAEVLRHLRQLHQDGRLGDDERAFKRLKSLARNNDPRLLVSFHASVDPATGAVDAEFFAESARELADEALAQDPAH